MKTEDEQVKEETFTEEQVEEVPVVEAANEEGEEVITAVVEEKETF